MYQQQEADRIIRMIVSKVEPDRTLQILEGRLWDKKNIA